MKGKYRVFDKHRKTMAYPNDAEYRHADSKNWCGFYYLLAPDGKLLCNDGVVFNDWSENYEVSFSTGMMDKKGKEIYCGDIVETNWANSDDEFTDIDEIVFRNGCFFIGQGDLDWMLSENNEDLTIIGNIYENPELLK